MFALEFWFFYTYRGSFYAFFLDSQPNKSRDGSLEKRRCQLSAGYLLPVIHHRQRRARARVPLEISIRCDSEASGFSFDADEAITTKSDDDLTGSAIASQPAAKIDQASEFKLSSMQLILALIVAMLLILVAAWFVYDFKERLERWRRKFRRIQAKFSGSGSSNVEFPLAPVEPLKVAPAETSTVTDLSRSSNDTDLDSISALVSAQG